MVHATLNEDMAVRGEFFFCHLLVLSAEQNDSQSEEVNVIEQVHAHAGS